MEMEYINENTMRVFLRDEDLKDRGVCLVDLFKDQSLVENFFMNVLEEADVNHRFKNSDALTFQVMPSQGGIDLYISKAQIDENTLTSEPEKETINSLINNLTESIASHVPASDGHIETESCGTLEKATLVFDKWEDFLLFAKAFQNKEVEVDLYNYQKKFYAIIALPTTLYSETEIQDLLYVALEYGVISPIDASLIREYGKLLIGYNAHSTIARYFS